MPQATASPLHEAEYKFKLFHELMSIKIREILLVSTPYDAWIMEEDNPLSERIIHEYRGLNLSQPPRLTWVSKAEEALARLGEHAFDMVITMPRLADMDPFAMGRRIKEKDPQLPVILFSHSSIPSRECSLDSPLGPRDIDRIYVWTGNTDLLLASIKSAEDRMNADRDTQAAGIRVIIFVEDSPVYLSSLLPILYKELVGQTQAVMEHGLNEEHRLLTMRARPKILVAEDFEEALALYQRFEPYVLGVISDVRFPKQCRLQEEAGTELLSIIKRERFDIPMLLMSSEPGNADKAKGIPADFVDKNSPSLHEDIRQFFQKRLGFGDFVFRMPDGSKIARASNLLSLERQLASIPRESFIQHCNHNDFSRWLFARTEITLATKFRPLRETDFRDVESHRRYLMEAIRETRTARQKGVVVNFDAQEFDPDTEFMKIGKGSLGGKARGLAFLSSLISRRHGLQEQYDSLRVVIPQTLVITTEGFVSFVQDNTLKRLAEKDLPDQDIAERFLQGAMPKWIEEQLLAYLRQASYPLAVRSSSLLEDAQFRAYAGLYRTYMIPNNCPDLKTRLEQLLEAVKLVYASTYFRAPKAFSRRVGHRTEEEQMAVIIQQLVGQERQGFFYPDVSGVAQSYNYYPFARMKPEDGSATIAMGLGKMVMEGGETLRFCPKYPELLPLGSNVNDILEHSQTSFYALKMDYTCNLTGESDASNLTRRDIIEAAAETPLKRLASSFIPEEGRIRDRPPSGSAYPVLTFAPLLKHRQVPLAEVLRDSLALAQEGLGCPVETEFSLDLEGQQEGRARFAFLQLRPMSARSEMGAVRIEERELEEALCYSEHALGNGIRQDMADILLVKPEAFDPGKTIRIAEEIGRFNARLEEQGRKFLLIGPGRWGSADRWLGIPVGWSDISGVGVLVEGTLDQLKAEPSQGSHFFHNIISLGINYFSITESGRELLDWERLQAMPRLEESEHVAHVRFEAGLRVKVDGRSSKGVILLPQGDQTTP